VSEANFGTDTTIKQLADEARARAMAHYGEAEFAKMCLEFDQRILPLDLYEEYADDEGAGRVEEDPQSKVTSVFKLIAKNKDPKTLQLALIWLDGHGWGKMKLESLHWWLDRVRNVYGEDEAVN
jgi:hypothetical protein